MMIVSSSGGDMGRLDSEDPKVLNIYERGAQN